MNQEQKRAWLSLVSYVIGIPCLVYIFIMLFTFGQLPDSFLGRGWPLIALWAFIVVTWICMLRKQSPKEVDSDERDKLIKRRAVLVGFVSVWILLAAVSIILWLIHGLDGAIPVWFLTIINLCVFSVVALIYQIAILVQYGWRGKDGE